MTEINVTSIVHHLIEKKFDDLTVRQLAILMECKNTRQTVRGLAERFKLNKPAITRAAYKLEGLGFIARAKDPRDGRSVFLTIAPSGRRFVKEFV